MSESQTAIEKLFNLLEGSRDDFVNGYNGTKAAARRGRKVLQEVRQLAKDARDELLAVSKDEKEPVSITLPKE